MPNIDLTTLPGWESLSAGSHNITIVARADGYRDSEPSAAVSVEKSSLYTVSFTFVEQMLSYKNYVRIYDGTNDSGTLLFESTGTSATPSTSVVCTTGNLYITVMSSDAFTAGVASTSEGITVVRDDYFSTTLKVTSDGTVVYSIDYSP